MASTLVPLAATGFVALDGLRSGIEYPVQFLVSLLVGLALVLMMGWSVWAPKRGRVSSAGLGAFGACVGWLAADLLSNQIVREALPFSLLLVGMSIEFMRREVYRGE
jgi:hypothetical protein